MARPQPRATALTKPPSTKEHPYEPDTVQAAPAPVAVVPAPQPEPVAAVPAPAAAKPQKADITVEVKVAPEEKPTRVPFTTRVDPELKKRLRRAALETDLSIEQLANDAFSAYLDALEKQPR